MLVIGCDPGETESAWVLYRTNHHEIERFGQDENAAVAVQLALYGKGGKVASLVIEMPANYGPAKGGAPLYKTARWAGVFAHAFDPNRGQPSVVYVTRPEIVLHWCGRRSGFTKAQVAAATAERLWGLTPRAAKGTVKAPGPVHGFTGYDLWDALELAAWYAETIELPTRKA